jgi:RNA polymerase sigma-70 factor (ECF subfamily)
MTTTALSIDLMLAAGNLGAVQPVTSGAGDMAAPSDTDLIARVAGGDADAFSALYARHSRAVFGVLLRLAGQRPLAEEWLQEAFTRVWLAAGTHDPARGPVKAWIFKIALNSARSELARKRHRVTHVSIEEKALDLADTRAGEPPLAGGLDDERRAQDLRDALARLPDFMREVVVLRCSRELSFAEIAEVTGAPEGTLKSRFHRAVAALRAGLAQERSRR